MKTLFCLIFSIFAVASTGLLIGCDKLENSELMIQKKVDSEEDLYQEFVLLAESDSASAPGTLVRWSNALSEVQGRLVVAIKQTPTETIRLQMVKILSRPKRRFTISANRCEHSSAIKAAEKIKSTYTEMYQLFRSTYPNFEISAGNGSMVIVVNAKRIGQVDCGNVDSGSGDQFYFY